MESIVKLISEKACGSLVKDVGWQLCLNIIMCKYKRNGMVKKGSILVDQ